MPYTNSDDVSSDYRRPPTRPPTRWPPPSITAATQATSIPPTPRPSLGSWDGNDLTARLTSAPCRSMPPTLPSATYGPPAQVSRTYLAANSSASRFAPGWVFNFDQHLDLSQLASGIVTYDDACGDAHQFLNSSGWTSPTRLSGHPCPERFDLDDHLPERHHRHLLCKRPLAKRVGPQRQHHNLRLERRQPDDHRGQRPDHRRNLQRRRAGHQGDLHHMLPAPARWTTQPPRPGR